MTPFQWLTVPLLGLAALRDAILLARSPGHRLFFAVRGERSPGPFRSTRSSPSRL